MWTLIDLVGREEAVLDALLERVGVDRLAEVVDVGDVFGFLRRGGEADLRGGGEVVEDLAPGGILGGAAAVALVDDDQVEEAGRELAEELLALLRAGDGLVEAEIDLVGGVDAALLVERRGEFDLGAVVALDGLRAGAELRHRRAEGAEVVDHRLVDEDVAVGEEEDALLAAGLPQPPDDLEGGVGLAGAGGHDEQDAVLALGDGLDGGVDGVAPGSSAAPCRCRRRSSPAGRSASASGVSPFQARYFAQSSSGDGKSSSARFASFSALVPVRSWKTKPSPLEEKTKGMFERRGIVEGLLHAVADAVVVVLGLDEGDGDVGLVVEDVVGALGLAAGDELAADDDPALGEADLLADLRHLIPARAS